MACHSVCFVLVQILLVIIVLIASISSLKATEIDSEVPEGRDPRLFKSVHIAPTLCRGERETGVCKPSKQCRRANGTDLRGTCGTYNAGICCLPIFTPTADQVPVTVTERVALLRSNDNFEENLFTIQRMNGSCQIKVEFRDFRFKMPSRGVCVDEEFWVTGSITVKSLTLCGPITRPIYLSYGNSDSIRLNFRSTLKTSFEVKIQHIDCNSAEKVDDHCLVAYTGQSGEVTSFGYGGMMQGYQISGLEYTVCVGGKVPTSSTITWEMCEVPDAPAPPLAGVLTTMNSFFTTRFLGAFGGTEQTCLDKVSSVGVPGIGTFCGGYFPRIQRAPTNMLLVTTIEDDESKFMNLPVTAFHPILMDEGWVTPPACDMATGPEGFTIFGNCVATLATTTHRCECDSMIRNADFATVVFGFCLRYSITGDRSG